MSGAEPAIAGWLLTSGADRWLPAGLVAAGLLLAGRKSPLDRLACVVRAGSRRPPRPAVRRWTIARSRRTRPGRTTGPDPDPAELAAQVAALSRAGLPLGRVWQVLAGNPGPAQPLCAAVAMTLSTGGRASTALRTVAGPPSVHWLGIALDVAERAGAPLADILDGFAVQLRDEDAASADREAALAGPRATTTLLSWLPLGGIGLGLLLGADPVGTLVATGPGRACLLVGFVLWWCGRWWTRALVRHAERAGG